MLQPDKRKQLDSNIRKMLENGASQDDVIAYSKDFNSKFDLKKKDESQSISQNPELESEAKEEVGLLGTSQNEPNVIELSEDDIAKSQEILTKPPKKEKEYSFVSELARGFQKGSSRLGEGFAAIPELLYDVAAIPQNYLADKKNLPLQLQFLSDLIGGEKLATDSEKFKDYVGVENTIKDYYSGQVERISKEQEEKDKPIIGGVTDNISEGNWSDAFRVIGKSVAESLPATIGIAMSGGATSTPQMVGGVATVFGASENEEYKKENPEMSPNERVVKSLGKGLAEGVFSSIGSAKIGVAAKEILAKEGKEEGAKILKAQLVNMYTEALKKYSIPAAMVGEGLEEAATTMTQNAIDGKPIMDGVADSFIIGVGSGAIMGTPLEVIKKVSKDKPTAKDIEAIEKTKDHPERVKQELTQQVKDKDLSTKEAKDIFNNWEELKSNLQAVPDDYTTEEKAKAVDLIKKKKTIEKEIEGKDPVLVEDKKAEIEELNNQLKTIKNTDAKTQEATTETKEQEVETATPETEVESKKIINEGKKGKDLLVSEVEGVENVPKELLNNISELQSQFYDEELDGDYDANLETSVISELENNGYSYNVSDIQSDVRVGTTETDIKKAQSKIITLAQSLHDDITIETNKDGTLKLYHGSDSKSLEIEGEIFASSSKNEEVGGVNGASFYGNNISELTVDPRKVKFSLNGEFLIEEEGVLQIKNNELTNETTPSTDTQSNADVQSRIAPSVQQGKDNAVQPTPDSGAVENEAEVKPNVKKETTEQEDLAQPTLDEIGDFLDSVDLETDKKNVKPKKKSTAKKLTLGNKTPLDKKKIKDPEMLKAIDTEVFDVDSIVQQYFINGGRVLSTEISRLYDGSTAEIRARMGYARKTGKRIEIKEIAHDLWQKHGENLNLDTADFENAIERVIGEHLSTKSMAVDLNNRNSQNINEELIDTPRGPMTQEQIDDLIKYEQEQEELVANYLLSLNESELIELDQEYKQYEQYETKRLNEESARKSESESRVQKDASRESEKSPEIQEVDKQITEAQDRVKKVKTALQNKAKALDESINKDQENLFGERKSQSENQLFDERVDLNKRDEATAKERQAVKDAEENLKQLQAKKKELQESGEVTPEMDFEGKPSQKPKVKKKKSKPTPIKKEPASRSEKIEDFGEKIGGARKDIVSELDGITNSDIANLPLSKSFPEPNYAKLIEDGIISKRGAIVLKFLYDSISNKPRSKYRIKTWVNSVEEAIKATKDIIEKESLLTEFIEGIEKTPTLAKKWEIHNAILEGFGFPKVLPKTGAYKITQFANKTGSSYAITKGSYIIGRDFKTLQNAVEGLKTILDKNKTKKVSVKLDVFQNKKTKEVYIGKKTATGVVKLMDGFKTAKDAFQFLDNNRTEVENIWNNLKINPEERRNSNRKRVGTDWRNGKDVTPEIFSNAFGFRGVEFGNWVNNNERQEALNETYDAFMDMANVLGLSPRSISLNGTLAMAFGARGKGKAMAHYEPGKVVINLTKKKGAGSLAHEWFHAMDNYFSRKFDKNDEYITNRPRTRFNRDGSLDTRIREEVLKAFKDVITAINESGLKTRSQQLDQSKSKLYWSTTIEMGARSFENFIIEKLEEQNEQNDFLANFKETSEWLSQTGLNLENYPYPLKEESDAINGAFSNLFETLDVVPEEGKTVSKLDELGNLLDEWDKNLDQFGKENLSMGLPILVAKVAIKAMKIAHKTAKTSLEVIEAGLKAVRDTDWYKNLTKEEQQEISATTIYQMVKNAQKQNNVNPEDVKAKINKKPKVEPKEDDFKRKSGKKSLLNRLIDGGNGKEITKSLENLGKEYDIRNQEEVDEFANAFIDRVGIGEALSAAKNGTIKNTDVKFMVFSEALERLKSEIDNESNTNDRDSLIKQFQELSGVLDEAARDAGQGIAILNHIYKKHENLKYSLAKQIADYKLRDPEGKIPKDIKEKFEELDEKLQELEKQKKEAEKRAEKAESKLAIDNIKESIGRENNKKSKDVLTSAQRKRKTELRKKFFNTFNDVTRMATLLADPEFREYIGLVYKEAKGDFQDFSKSILKELGKGARKHLPQLFKEAGGKKDVQLTDLSSVEIDEEGNISIPTQLIRDYVEQGIEDIDEISQLILDELIEEHPELTLREVRDAITKYGKQSNLNQEEIATKIRKMKRLGKLLSMEEDVHSGKRPKRSGLQRDKLSQEERKRLREIRDLMRDLPKDSADLAKEWKTALDAVKSRLKNHIEDLQKQIDNKEKSKPSKTPIKFDQEAKYLKQRRDDLKAELESIVGKPQLTDEQKIDRIIKSLESSIEKLEDDIKNNRIAYKDKTKGITSAKIESLKDTQKSLKETLQKMRVDAGLVEKKRLETSKKRVQRQIEEYKRRLKEQDFSKRKVDPIKADSELDKIRAEREAIFEEYEKEKHRHELANRTAKEKWFDAILEGFAVGRALKASLDLGLIGIQLRHFTYGELLRNPKRLGGKLIKMFGSIGSQSKSDKARKALLAHPLHRLANDLDIGLTNPDLRDEVREEASAGSLLSFVWNSPMFVLDVLGKGNITEAKFKSIGDTVIDSALEQYNKIAKNKVEIKDKKKFSVKEQWKNVNIFRDVERGLSTYGNQMRFEEFIRGVEKLKAQGKDEINHKKEYEALASYIRTFSGRAKPAGFEMNQKALNLFSFSFKNATSVFQQLNPFYYMNLASKHEGKGLKANVATRMAMSSMFKTVSMNVASIAFIMAGYAAIKDEDDEEMTLETDPTSSDFGKLRIGSFRYDPWGGYVPLITLYARLFTEEVKKQDGTKYKMGESRFGIANRMDAISKFIGNKKAPVTGGVFAYLTSVESEDKETGETYRKTPWGGKLTDSEALSPMPIFMESVKDAVENDYDGVKSFLTAYSILGLGNTQDYKSSSSSKKKKPKLPKPKLPKIPKPPTP